MSLTENVGTLPITVPLFPCYCSDFTQVSNTDFCKVL